LGCLYAVMLWGFWLFQHNSRKDVQAVCSSLTRRTPSICMSDRLSEWHWFSILLESLSPAAPQLECCWQCRSH
jgi:hypothetical protein